MILKDICKIFRFMLIATALLASGTFVLAQPLGEKNPYYVNINNIQQGSIHEISDYLLHLEYFDAYGTEKEFLLKIYDWERRTIATLRLDKSYGLNNYTIKLYEVYSNWELDKTYTGEFKNEGGTLFRLPVRIVSPPVKDEPLVSITVNPLQIDCTDLSQNLIEFYGNVQGGKAPYMICWFVLNNARTDFLYQPKQELISLPGKTSLILVDKSPEYYVVLYVIDACGNEQKQIINMVCGNGKKKINTVFVEEFTSPLFKDKISIQ